MQIEYFKRIANNSFIIKICFTVVLLLFAWSLFTYNNYNSYTGFENNSYQIIYVNSGDSLWLIAKKFITDQQDIRDFIYRIIKINNLNNNGQIFPGQILLIPTNKQSKTNIIIDSIDLVKK